MSGESFFEKIGTLGRKNKHKEEAPFQQEPVIYHDIDIPGLKLALNIDDISSLDENEERWIISEESRSDPRLRELIRVLIEWVNDELSAYRIIIQEPIEEELFDGQVLQKLIEKLEGIRIEISEVTQTKEGQLKKLRVVVEEINRILPETDSQQIKWTANAIHSKNTMSVLHILVALARHYRAPIRFPENVRVKCTVVQKRDGSIHPRHDVTEELTSTYADWGQKQEQRDAFDTLFEHAPEKLALVKNKLLQFANQHLSRLNLEVTDLDTQFHDGVYFILLMGLLEGYFVPLYSYHPTPTSFDQKVSNCSLAFEFMQEAGIPQPKPRPEDVVNLDLKSTLRVLYGVFSKWKSVAA